MPPKGRCSAMPRHSVKISPPQSFAHPRVGVMLPPRAFGSDTARKKIVGSCYNTGPAHSSIKVDGGSAERHDWTRRAGRRAESAYFGRDSEGAAASVPFHPEARGR